MKRLYGLVGGATILVASMCWAQQNIDPKLLQQTYVEATVRSLNEVVDVAKLPTAADEVLWEREFNQTSTRYIQFYFDQIRYTKGADFVIRILRIPSERPIAIYSSSSFAANAEFITGLLPAERLRVQLVVATSAKPDLSFRLFQVMWQARPGENATPQSLVPRWDPVTSLQPADEIAKWSSSVAMLHIGPTEVTCTGVLIDYRTVATNYHCIHYSLQFLKSENAEKKFCDDVIIEFDYLRAGTLGVSTRCVAVRANAELDVALLSIDAAAIRLNSGEVRNPVRVRPPGEPLTGALNIIHHPEGLPLSYESNCKLKEIEGKELLHSCDTSSGSSGSPVFDAQMRWAGLHFKGPYPNTWTIQRVLDDRRDNGPKYNRAKMSDDIMSFAQTSISPN